MRSYFENAFKDMKYVEILRLGGAGNKCANVILGQADAYISSRLCNWDLCGPEALVKAMGGYATDI